MYFDKANEPQGRLEKKLGLLHGYSKPSLRLFYAKFGAGLGLDMPLWEKL